MVAGEVEGVWLTDGEHDAGDAGCEAVYALEDAREEL